jgi:hypothetical protein
MPPATAQPSHSPKPAAAVSRLCRPLVNCNYVQPLLHPAPASWHVPFVAPAWACSIVPQQEQQQQVRPEYCRHNVQDASCWCSPHLCVKSSGAAPCIPFSGTALLFEHTAWLLCSLLTAGMLAYGVRLPLHETSIITRVPCAHV